jgi:hypothetical protein
LSDDGGVADDGLATTQHSLHVLAEHVLAAARYAATGRIGLAVVIDGIATPPFGPDDRVVGVVSRDLVVRRNGVEHRVPVTTLRAAGEFVGVAPGALASVYAPSTEVALDEPLAIDADGYARFIEWYALVDAALRRFRAEIPADDPGDITLWPEHLDVAIRAAEVNYGGLGADATVTSPYVYVGPAADALPPTPAGIWNQPFGATRTWDEVTSVDDAVDFFHHGRAAAQALSAAPS